MAVTILRGTIISSVSPTALQVTPEGYLVAEEGRIIDVFPVLPERYQGAQVQDWGKCLILQSLCDLHLHAPQYPMIGTGMDLPLLEWLNTYTFPTEARFADPDYAREVFSALARELIQNGTTRVCVFSSLHRPATLILMEELERAGVSGYVGKVNMDRNAIAGLEETTEDSIRQTLLWLEQCQGLPHIRPILTPRFTPSCSDRLMAFLGDLAVKQNLPVQSHLSENQSEVQWVRQLHPDCAQYWQTYAKYGLWNSRTLMAHCVWSDAQERQAMIRAGVTMVHCPSSNENLCSGIAPVRAMLREGGRVVLGSDIAGGAHLNLFDVVADAIGASKVRQMLDGEESPFLTVPEAWYLATSAPAEFFGQAPGFAPGNCLHALVLDDSALPPLTDPVSRLERAFYRRQPGAVRAVWSEGKPVFVS